MASASPARRVAHKVLFRVFEEDAYADRAFASEAKDLDARDRAFAQRIAYGAIQMVRTLDHAIERLGGRPVDAMDAPVQAAIRLGSYELAFLGGVPARASVNEAVELVNLRLSAIGTASIFCFGVVGGRFSASAFLPPWNRPQSTSTLACLVCT